MARSLLVLVALAACGTTKTPITSKVTTLGYSHPPAVVVVGHGTPELVDPWIASLRASKAVTIVAEISKPPDENDASDVICLDARTAANVTPIEEILVIRPVVTEKLLDRCASLTSSGYCSSRAYLGHAVTITTTMIAYRASTCAQVRQTVLSVASGVSSDRGIVSPTADPVDDLPAVERAKTLDIEEATGFAIERIVEIAPKISWNMFPTGSSIERVDGNTIVIAGPLQLGDYLLKQPSSTQLVPGVRVVEKTVNQTTLEVEDSIEPEPGDELHRVTDVITSVGFMSVSGGTAMGNGTKKIIGGPALVGRMSAGRSVWMLEGRFGGDFVPAFDSSVITASAAGGLRLPYWISPVVFVELGVGGVSQGDDGGRAVAGLAGIGGGLEIRRSRWFAFADVRLRGFAFSDWTDSEEQPIDVDYPDQTWRTTTGQLGIGFRH